MRTASSSDRWLRLAVVLVVAVAAGLRFYALDLHSVWLDEASSIKYSQTLDRALGRVFHPPGYYVVLYVWGQLFSYSAAALRFISAVAGTVTVWVVYRIGVLLLAHRGLAVLAAGLYAVLPAAVWFSRELRMYAPWTMFLVLALWALLAIDARGRSWPRVIGYWSALGAAALMHYYTVFYAGVIAVAAFVLIGNRRGIKTRGELWPWAGLHGPLIVGGLFILVRIGVAAGDRGLVGYLLNNLGGSRSQPIGASLAHLFFFRNWAYRVPGDWADLFGGILFWVLLLASIAYALDARVKLGRRLTLLMMAWLPFVVIVVSPIRNYPRVVTPSAVFFVLLLAYGLALAPLKGGRWWSVLTAGLTVGFVFLLSPRLGDVYALEVESWNTVCDRIEAEQGPNDVILISASFTKKAFDICYDGPSRVVGFPDHDEGVTTAQVVATASAQPGVWVIYSHAEPQAEAKRRKVVDMDRAAVFGLRRQFRRTDRWSAGPFIEVFRFQR